MSNLVSEIAQILEPWAWETKSYNAKVARDDATAKAEQIVQLIAGLSPQTLPAPGEVEHATQPATSQDAPLPQHGPSQEDMKAIWRMVPPAPVTSQEGHEYGPSRVGHGEAQCIHCPGTNRENAVIAPNRCPSRLAATPTTPTLATEAGAVADVAAIAASLGGGQRKALLSTNGPALSQGQSDRGTLIGPLTDYSFRPARLTPLGLAVRQHLTSQGATAS